MCRAAIHPWCVLAHAYDVMFGVNACVLHRHPRVAIPPWSPRHSLPALSHPSIPSPTCTYPPSLPHHTFTIHYSPQESERQPQRTSDQRHPEPLPVALSTVILALLAQQCALRCDPHILHIHNHVCCGGGWMLRWSTQGLCAALCLHS